MYPLTKAKDGDMMGLGGARHQRRWPILLMAMLIVSSLPPSGAQDTDIDGIPDALELSLAERFAPVLRFTQGESYFPVSVEYALDNSELKQITDSGNRTLASSPTIQKISVYRNEEGKYYLDNVHGGIDDSGIRDHFISSREEVQPTVYARVTGDSNDTVVQYWFYYPFNDGPLNNHEGDWEMVQVRLAGEEPVFLAYSQHYEGQAAAWGDALLRNDHPVVYVARGSHANYFRSYQGVLGVHSDQVSGSGPALGPEDYELVLVGEMEHHEPNDGWLNFAGRWGEWGEDADELRGRRGPPGPSHGQNAEKWENPASWEIDLRELNTRWLWLSWLVANFTVLFVVYLVIRGGWSLLRLGRTIREGKLLRCVGTGAVMAVLGAAIALLAIPQPWYSIRLNVPEGEYATKGFVSLMRLDGVKGLQISDPQSNRGMVTLYAVQIPTGLIFVSSFIFLLLDILKATEPGRLKGGLIRKGVERLLVPVVPILILIVAMGSMMSSAAEATLRGDVPPAVSEIMDSVQSSPVSGSYEGEVTEVGGVELRWGLQAGSMMMLLAGFLILLGGMLSGLGSGSNLKEGAST